MKTELDFYKGPFQKNFEFLLFNIEQSREKRSCKRKNNSKKIYNRFSKLKYDYSELI